MDDFPLPVLAYDPLLDPTNSSRKRSRPNTPTPQNNNNHVPAIDTTIPSPVVPTESLADKLKDPVKRNGALNELLQASSVNYALDGEAVLQELEAIVFDCLDWDPEQYAKEPKATFRPEQAWTTQPTEEAQAWAVRCEERFSSRGTVMAPEKLRTVEAIIVILRNFSFAAANARLMAFSPDILAILMGCLYEGTFSSSPSRSEDSNAGSSVLSLSALHAILNLAPHLDVTGQKLFCDKLFLNQKNENYEGPLVPNPSSFGKAVDGSWGFGSIFLAKRLDTKEDVITDIPKSTLLELTNAAEYVVQVWSLFPALKFIFSDPKSPRAVMMMAVDLVQEFVNHARVGVVGSVEQEQDIPSARAILVNIPDSVLERLADLLYVPRLGPDSLNYEDPTTNIVTRVNYYNLMKGYEASVDTDVRDRALDVLLPLLELDSPRMAERLIAYPKNGRLRTRLCDALVPILAGQVGRSESSMLASQLLKELAKAGKQAKIAITYIQERLVELASRDARMSQLLLTHLHPPESQATDENTSDEQEESI